MSNFQSQQPMWSVSRVTLVTFFTIQNFLCCTKHFHELFVLNLDSCLWHKETKTEKSLIDFCSPWCVLQILKAYQLRWSLVLLDLCWNQRQADKCMQSVRTFALLMEAFYNFQFHTELLAFLQKRNCCIRSMCMQTLVWKHCAQHIQMSGR